MKKNLLLFGYLVVVSVFLIGCEAIQESFTSFESQALGDYASSIWSGGTEYPGTTTFTFDKNDYLKGTYDYKEKDGMTTGKLFDCTPENKTKVKCKWEDKYGSGDLNITFADDFSNFKGKWNAEGKSEKYDWNGKRK